MLAFCMGLPECKLRKIGVGLSCAKQSAVTSRKRHHKTVAVQKTSAYCISYAIMLIRRNASISKETGRTTSSQQAAVQSDVPV